jgi:hypothetical protein
LEERQILLSLQEMDLERREEKLAEEHAHGLYPFDGRGLLAKLEELREHVAGVESERVAKAMKLSRSVMEIYDVLVDLGVFPIRDAPEHLKSAQDAFTVAGLILESLQEERASDAGSWVQKLARPVPP